MRRIVPILFLTTLAGCSDSRMEKASGPPNAPRAEAAGDPIAQALNNADQAALFQRKEGPAGAMGPGGFGPPALLPAEKPVSRKIIYTGTVELIVTDFDNARKQVVALAEQNGGYVANFNVDATSGDRRRATYTVRVPVAKFQASLDAFAALGHVLTTHTNSQDITDEFYDLEARLKTKQEEEKTLREILAKSAVKLEDILTMRRELKQIREEIESTQGRLNKLSKLSELTTITVIMQEGKDFVPPTAPTFASRAGETLTDSAGAFWGFIKAIALALVALLPWTPLLIAVVVPGFLVIRRINRSSAASGRIGTIEPAPPPAVQLPPSN